MGMKNKVSIETLIKQYEQSYMAFMGIKHMPSYKIEPFAIDMSEVNKNDFGVMAQAKYNPKTGEHVLRVCADIELMEYVAFHEFTHILDSEIYAKDDPVQYMAISGVTEYNASQVELLKMIGVDSFYDDISFSMDMKIDTVSGRKSVRDYVIDKFEHAELLFSRADFPANIEMLKTAFGVWHNYLGLRSICKMYSVDYFEETNNKAFLAFMSTQEFHMMNNVMNDLLDRNKIEIAKQLYITVLFRLIKEYGLL